MISTSKEGKESSLSQSHATGQEAPSVVAVTAPLCCPSEEEVDAEHSDLREKERTGPSWLAFFLPEERSSLNSWGVLEWDGILQTRGVFIEDVTSYHGFSPLPTHHERRLPTCSELGKGCGPGVSSPSECIQALKNSEAELSNGDWKHTSTVSRIKFPGALPRQQNSREAP